MSLSAGRMLGASIRYSTTGKGPPCSGWKTNVVISPSGVVTSTSRSIIRRVWQPGRRAPASSCPRPRHRPVRSRRSSRPGECPPRPPSSGDRASSDLPATAVQRRAHAAAGPRAPGACPRRKLAVEAATATASSTAPSTARSRRRRGPGRPRRTGPRRRPSGSAVRWPGGAPRPARSPPRHGLRRRGPGARRSGRARCRCRRRPAAPRRPQPHAAAESSRAVASRPVASIAHTVSIGLPTRREMSTASSAAGDRLRRGRPRTPRPRATASQARGQPLLFAELPVDDLRGVPVPDRGRVVPTKVGDVGEAVERRADPRPAVEPAHDRQHLGEGVPGRLDPASLQVHEPRWYRFSASTKLSPLEPGER